MIVKKAIFFVTGLIACASCAPTRDGAYVGVLTTEHGYCGMAEDSHGATPATLSIRGQEAQFEPESGVIILTGRINNAGHVLVQSNAPGADHKPFTQVFEGDLIGNRITGRFATPRCRAAVSLSHQ